MIRIKLSTSFPAHPLIRQTPGSKGRWGDCEFHINESVDQCDWWVVYEGLKQPETAECSARNIVFISGEPPASRKYKRRFLSQFSKIVTSHRLFFYRNILHTQQALPWRVGFEHTRKVARLSYDDFASMKSALKTRQLSVVVSSKTITEGHRRRLIFLDALKAYFGNQIEVFGRGINEVEDKWNAIAPFRYHVVMENSYYRNYFTEKLSDAYLGFSYPFYYGCPNLSDYYPRQAFTPIDIRQPERAIEIIKQAMDADLYSANLKYLYEARDLTLNKYNLFPMLAEICRSSSTRDRRPVTLYPERMM